MFKSVTEIFGSWFHLSAVHEIVGHTHIEEVELRSSNSPSFLCGSESRNKIPYERILKNAEVVGVISNNYNVFSLERAEKAGIPNAVVSPKDFPSRDEFNAANEQAEAEGKTPATYSPVLCYRDSNEAIMAYNEGHGLPIDLSPAFSVFWHLTHLE